MSNPFISELVGQIDRRFNVDTKSMSLGDWICANTTIRGVPFTFDRYPFQKQIADDLSPNVDVIKPSQVGLALDVQTPILTRNGWSTMGDLTAGDFVFDEQGQPTEVIYVSPVFSNHDCYQITFCDGEQIVADANHRWYVECDKAFNDEGLYPKSGRIPLNSDYQRTGVIRTELLARIYQQGKRNLFAIPNTKPLQTPKTALPIDPYTLGLWLGNGHGHSANISCGNQDFEFYTAELTRLGYEISSEQDKNGHWLIKPEVAGSVRRHRTHPSGETSKMFDRLSQLNLLRNKHIPEIYLTAAPEDRLSLLQGLIDTDGHITKRGQVAFYNACLPLVQDFIHLARSLGIKTRLRNKGIAPASKLSNGVTIRPKQELYEIRFTAYQEQPASRMPRKRECLRLKDEGRASEAHRRRIVNVEKVATRPTRCISVDSPRHLFLAGKALIPTHNTEVQIRKTLAFAARNRGTTSIFTMPNEKMQKRMSTTRVKPIVDTDRAFNLETANGEKPTRSMGLMQIGTSFVFLTGMTEGDATSISADAVFNDEIDISDQQMLALFNSRLQNSDWKINQRFSTPTFTNFGVDKGFSLSNQFEFMCRCAACNHWNIPTFLPQFIHLPGLKRDLTDLAEIDEQMIDDGLDLDGAYVRCERCKAPLPLGDMAYREWVPRFPSRDHHHGYRVSPFSTDRLSPKYIITQLLKYKGRDYMRGWYNTVLGQAFTDGNARLSDADINACFTSTMSVPEVDKTAPAWIGIDMGQTCHCVVAVGDDIDKLHVVRFAEVSIGKLADWVDEMCATYNVVGGACDRHPYTPNADDLRERTEGRILPVEYRGQKTLNFVLNELDESITHAQANRTQAADAVARAVRRKLITFSGYGMSRPVIVDHLKDMVRDESPEKEATWVKLTGNDHYFHSLIFLMLGIQMKDVARQLFANPRTTVAVASATVPGGSSLIGNRK